MDHNSIVLSFGVILRRGFMAQGRRGWKNFPPVFSGQNPMRIPWFVWKIHQLIDVDRWLNPSVSWLRTVFSTDAGFRNHPQYVRTYEKYIWAQTWIHISWYICSCSYKNAPLVSHLLDDWSWILSGTVCLAHKRIQGQGLQVAKDLNSRPILFHVGAAFSSTVYSR